MRRHGRPAVPFFTAPGAEGTPTGERPRLLLISYHFPPGTAAGALRWQKLAGIATERGWALDVVTLHPRSVVGGAPERLAELPAGTRVFGVARRTVIAERLEHAAWTAYRRIRRRTPAVEPTESAAATPAPKRRRSSLTPQEMSWLRAPRDLARTAFAWIEHARERAWARDATALGARVVRPALHGAIITCGPPHMAHRAGEHLSRRTGLPLIADLRDPWSLVERLPEHLASPLWLRLARHHERAVVARAALVVMNTGHAAAAMRAIYPSAADRIITVMNGFDEAAAPPAAEPPSRFTIAYTGTIYLDRDPSPLFRAAAKVIGELGLRPEELGIELMGHCESYDGLSVEELVRRERLDAHVRRHPPAPRAEAMRLLARASLLVSLPQDSDMAIPSKVFEYLPFRAWVLALARPDSATDEALRGTGADVVAPEDVPGIAAVIRDRYLRFRRGDAPPCLATMNPQLSREAQGQRLFDALEALVPQPRTPERREVAAVQPVAR